MPARKPARKARDVPPHETDTKTVARIRAEAEAAAAKPPVAHELPPAGVMAQLADVEVQELDGSWTTFGAIWAACPAALIFLRHYG
jgi:hypothetical protein